MTPLTWGTRGTLTPESKSPLSENIVNLSTVFQIDSPPSVWESGENPRFQIHILVHFRYLRIHPLNSRPNSHTDCLRQWYKNFRQTRS
jgi:hypothetical protein